MNKNNEPNSDSIHSRDASLPWDLFQNWIYCICIVTFDLELGQAMEVGQIKLLKKIIFNKLNVNKRILYL